MTTVPVVSEWAADIQATPVGRGWAGVFLLLAFLDAQVLWLSAVRHCWVMGPGKAAAFLLVFTNFLGAFFYYFVIARREPGHRESHRLADH